VFFNRYVVAVNRTTALPLTHVLQIRSFNDTTARRNPSNNPITTNNTTNPATSVAHHAD
jgi:hypothetical protein